MKTTHYFWFTFCLQKIQFSLWSLTIVDATAVILLAWPSYNSSYYCAVARVCLQNSKVFSFTRGFKKNLETLLGNKISKKTKVRKFTAKQIQKFKLMNKLMSMHLHTILHKVASVITAFSKGKKTKRHLCVLLQVMFKAHNFFRNVLKMT